MQAQAQAQADSSHTRLCPRGCVTHVEEPFGEPLAQLDRLRAVTPDQIRAFAADRLGTDNRAILTYLPKGAA
jgi:hypothetical protein